MKLEEIINIVKEGLSEKRFKHSYSVMERCEELARIYGEDVQKAKLVGIAHDIAKEMSSQESLKYIADNSLQADEIELERNGLLHGKIAADICKKRFGFTCEMVRAIEMHTTGNINMTLFDKILFVADLDNKELPELGIFEGSSIGDINKAVLYVLNYKIKKTIADNSILHPKSIIARNEILKNKFLFHTVIVSILL